MGSWLGGDGSQGGRGASSGWPGARLSWNRIVMSRSGNLQEGSDRVGYVTFAGERLSVCITCLQNMPSNPSGLLRILRTNAFVSLLVGFHRRLHCRLSRADPLRTGELCGMPTKHSQGRGNCTSPGVRLALVRGRPAAWQTKDGRLVLGRTI